MEKISIQNFAGIKELDFEFKSINILIGPQGVGKSVTVKFHYFFRNFFQELARNIILEESTEDLDRIQRDRFVVFFPRHTWPEGDFKITYSLDEVQLNLEKKEGEIQFYYSEYLKSAISKIKAAYKEEVTNLKSLGKISASVERVSELIKIHIHEYLSYNQLFIPAGRSFFANIQSNIFFLLKAQSPLDPFLIEFGATYEDFKRVYKHEQIKGKDNSFDEIIADILNGDYLREDDEDFLVHKDHRKVILSSTSSGQQETLPLIVFLWVLYYGMYRDATIYIEEPEAHLFPDAQKAITQLLARLFNNSEHRFQIFVTTHSPYILSSFNNLLEAGRISELMPEKAKQIAEIVHEEEQLKSGLLTAYSINNGKKDDLIDQETNLITQTILDGISNDIAIEFGKLLDIEF
ncbi:AAA family ATPase [Chitinophaga pinensis]|uniref:AAA family ATPase n=1 Tax=Chitinophaga pinensis TaxID=79329 RepID=A0A5C6LKM5_9BACT|nr:AAA family ATPase [Chitinophaga pinensis]TWV96211.1 AAA family ATPase [Chitinophaga pinensis]